MLHRAAADRPLRRCPRPRGRQVNLGVGTQRKGLRRRRGAGAERQPLLQGGQSAVHAHRTRRARLPFHAAGGFDRLAGTGAARPPRPRHVPRPRLRPRPLRTARLRPRRRADVDTRKSASQTPSRTANSTRAAPVPEALVATLAEHDRRLLDSLPWAPFARRPPPAGSRRGARAGDRGRLALDSAAQLHARCRRDRRDSSRVARTRHAPATTRMEGEALRISATRRETQYEVQTQRRGMVALREPLDRSLKLFGRTFAPTR